MFKDEYPEAIADWLGIPAVMGIAGPWMSNEGTVMKDWLIAVGEALDVPYAGEKTRMMRDLVEAVGMTWDESTMTSRGTRSGGGGNIKPAAFAAVLEALEDMPPVRARYDASREPQPFTPRFRPGATEDRKILAAIRIRAGQPAFRARLLEIYGAQCAVTDCDAPEALEAAHVISYAAGGTYDESNGLLLRADLHTLFDKGLLAFDPRRRLLVHYSIQGTDYASFQGTRLRDPRPGGRCVPDRFLAAHRAQAGF